MSSLDGKHCRKIMMSQRDSEFFCAGYQACRCDCWSCVVARDVLEKYGHVATHATEKELEDLMAKIRSADKANAQQRQQEVRERRQKLPNFQKCALAIAEDGDFSQFLVDPTFDVNELGTFRRCPCDWISDEIVAGSLLHVACLVGNAEAIKALLTHGVNPAIRARSVIHTELHGPQNEYHDEVEQSGVLAGSLASKDLLVRLGLAQDLSVGTELS